MICRPIRGVVLHHPDGPVQHHKQQGKQGDHIEANEVKPLQHLIILIILAIMLLQCSNLFKVQGVSIKYIFMLYSKLKASDMHNFLLNTKPQKWKQSYEQINIK